MLGRGTPAVDRLVPDYSLIDGPNHGYLPADSYFCRVSKGCVRKCAFCAVPTLEPEFGVCSTLTRQVRRINQRFGEKQHLVILDNNILALPHFEGVIAELRDLGFVSGAKRLRRQRTIDFNQGLDARLITRETARLLATVCLHPVRLAFDFDAMEQPYRRAVAHLSRAGFVEFTNYLMFNYRDTPASLYGRLRVNAELSAALGIRVTGFPMRYVPVEDVSRRHVSSGWHWRYLRGLQCILHATHGLVSPNPDFFAAAFGETAEEFVELVAMPDRYIVYRRQFKHHEAHAWRRLYRKLSEADRGEFLDVLAMLNGSRQKAADGAVYPKYAALLEHYYPDGQVPHGNTARSSPRADAPHSARGSSGAVSKP